MPEETTQTSRADIDLAQITGSLVHEIKNPLSTLSINAQLLLEEWKEPASQREERTVRRLKIMATEVERMESEKVVAEKVAAVATGG